MNIRFVALAIILAAQSAWAQKTWDLNDVTYIYGLNVSVEAGVRLSEFLPRAVYDQAIGQTGLSPGARTPGLVLSAQELYQNLSIVAFRIDPCFRDVFTDPCRRQIRVVWQPITQVQGKWTTVDAALHTFYDLTPEQFEWVKKNLLLLKQAAHLQTSQLPLQIHPGLKEKNSYAQSLQALLRRVIAWKNTTRIAVMKLMMGENGWRFNSFDVVGGQLKIMQIFPGLIQEQQLNNLAAEGAFDARGSMGSSIMREKPDQVLRVIADSREPSLQDLEVLKLYFSRSIRITQPHLHLPGTVDCLSCHASDGVKAVTARALIAKGFDVKLSNGSQRYNMRNLSAKYGSTRNMRGLGYFGSGLQILDRTIQESAEVADSLNGRR